MMRRQLNIRVSEYTRKQLTALCAATGLTESGVITLALDRLAALDADAARKRISRQDRLLDILAKHYGEPPLVIAWLKADRNGELTLTGGEEPDTCAECGSDLDAVWIGVLSDGSMHMPVCSGCARSE